MAAKPPAPEVKKTDEQKILEEFCRKPLQKRERNTLYGYTRLSVDLELTKHYKGQLPIPRAPIFHPYNPNEKPMPLHYAGIPATVVTVRCPLAARKQLPELIQKLLNDLSVDLNKLDLFFVTQNMPWENIDGSLLMRPHYWIHGETVNDKVIEEGTFTHDTPCRVGIFSSRETTVTCGGSKNTLNPPVSVNSHPGVGRHPGEKMIISSPSAVSVVRGLDFNTSESFYSIVAAANGRVAVTLHWMLSPADQAHIIDISNRVNNIQSLIIELEKLKSSRLTMENGPLFDLTKLLNINISELKKELEEKAKRDQELARIYKEEELAFALALSLSAKEEEDRRRRPVAIPTENTPLQSLKKLPNKLTLIEKDLMRLSEEFGKLDEHVAAANVNSKFEEFSKFSKKVLEQIRVLEEFEKIGNRASSDHIENRAKNISDECATAIFLAHEYIDAQKKYLQGQIETLRLIGQVDLPEQPKKPSPKP